jgi:hypothetical protein
LFAVYAFIAAGLQAARAFSSAKPGPVIGHLLLALVDLAAGVVVLAWPGCAEVSMLVAKNRRQPPSSAGRGKPGSGWAQARLAQLRRSLRRGWDRAEQTSPLSGFIASATPAAAPVKSLPLPSARWRLLVSGRMLPEPRSAQQARPIAPTNTSRAATDFGRARLWRRLVDEWQSSIAQRRIQASEQGQGRTRAGRKGARLRPGDRLRAVLMHIADRMAALRRMTSWLAPGGWLVAEEVDFGMWLADYDPVWAAHPAAWHEAFPHGRWARAGPLLRQIHQLGQTGIRADADLDIVQPGTDLAEFYQLSIAALAEPMISAGIMTAGDAARLAGRPADPDFLGCVFAFIGASGSAPGRPREPRPRESVPAGTAGQRRPRRH